jgi:hypothetical protein
MAARPVELRSGTAERDINGSNMATTVITTPGLAASISRASWRALVASWLGWMFDGYETYGLVLVMAPAVHQLLAPERLSRASLYMGGLLAATMVGWAAGGVAAGVAADYIGRRRTLMLSILCYAVFAGLAAISWNYWSLLIFRFLTGLGLGAEWGPGAAIVAEFWPPASRGRAGGALHAAHGVGFLLASGVWLLLIPLGPSSWRYMFLIGIVPAFLLLYLRRWVDEPALWVASDHRRREARQRLESGGSSSDDKKLAQFSPHALHSTDRVINDSQLVNRLGDADVAEHLRAVFVPLIRARIIRCEERALGGPAVRLSGWKPFQATHSETRPTVNSPRTLFNLVPCNRELEVAFAKFSTAAEVVSAFQDRHCTLDRADRVAADR